MGNLDDLTQRQRLMRTQRTAISETFFSWGYDEVYVPIVSQYETLQNRSCLPDSAVYKLLDGDGGIRMLRPDMTASVAWQAAVQWSDVPRPLRVCYFGEVFRRTQSGGGVASIAQAGVELIGTGSPESDAEVVALSADALRAAGLCSFQINLGHNGLLSEIADELDMQSCASDSMRDALVRKDFVAARDIVKASGHSALSEGLMHILTPDNAAEPMQILSEIGGSLPGLRQLQAVFEALRDFNLTDRVHIDISLAGDFSYYTGVIFDIYHARCGMRLGGGGRYDDLLAAFGSRNEATGFALDLASVCRSASGACRVDNAAPLWLVAGDEGCRPKMTRRCEQLRKNGCRAVVKTICGMDTDELAQWADCRGYDYLEVVRPGSDSAQIPLSGRSGEDDTGG